MTEQPSLMVAGKIQRSHRGCKVVWLRLMDGRLFVYIESSITYYGLKPSWMYESLVGEVDRYRLAEWEESERVRKAIPRWLFLKRMRMARHPKPREGILPIKAQGDATLRFNWSTLSAECTQSESFKIGETPPAVLEVLKREIEMRMLRAEN